MAGADSLSSNLLSRLDALVDLPVGVTAIADEAIFRDAAAEIRSLEQRLEAANARIQRWQMDGVSDETTAKPTDSELYSSSELFRHIWVCPMGWIGDKLIYGPGYTSADMKPWLVKLRRLAGFEHPEGTPLEQPEKAVEKP